MAIASFNGALSLAQWRQAAAAAGQYYVAINPAPGTAVQYALVTSFSATANGLFTVSNNNPAGGKTISLDQLVLNMTGTAPTGTTVMKFAAYNEAGIVAPSAGSVAVTPRNVLASGPATGAVINGYSAGAATIPAAVGTRTNTGNWSVPTSLGITGDTYISVFGADPLTIPGSTAVRATAPAALAIAAPPLTIAPQNTCIIDMWWVTAGTTAPSFEFCLSYIEQ